MSTPARDVYAATLAPRPGGRVLRGARFAGAFLAELAWQLLPSPATHDVVVTRRADGREVLRQSAGPAMTMGTDLAQVQEHLDTLDDVAFRARWGITEDS